MAQEASPPTDSLSAARRFASIVSLASREYGLGVPPEGGRVLVVEEVEEAKLFLDQAAFDVPDLPAAAREDLGRELAALRARLEQLPPPAEVAERTRVMLARLAARVDGPLEPHPDRPPSLVRGRAVYAEQCAACHGDLGRGDGPKAATLEGPPPSDLTDPSIMAGVPLVEVYSRVTVGVPGTAMPEFESTLSTDDRWAVAAYAATLHAPSPTAAVFASARRLVDSAVTAGSARLAFDAYLEFERVESDVRARRPGVATEVEAAFAGLRTRVAAADAEERRALRARTLAALEQAERVLADRPSGTALFAQSLVILLREGFEAILIIAALLAFAAKAGAADRRREIAWGAWLAVAASVVTAVVFELVFELSPAHREALEGFTLLLATAVLFYVSYWLLSRIEATKWTSFVRDRMQNALTSGSAMALAGVAFLAVYREGFETILFYKALIVSAGDGAGLGGVLAGMAAGAVALVGVYIAVKALGLRLPLRPFFAATGAMLYLMAFIFAGKGIAELQEAGLVRMTVVSWMPRFELLGIYPTVESLALQALLGGLGVAAFVWLRIRPASEGASASG